MVGFLALINALMNGASRTRLGGFGLSGAIALGGLWLYPLSSQAQGLPRLAVPPPPAIPTTPPSPLSPGLEPHLTLPTTPTLPEFLPADSPTTFTVNGFRIEGNTVFSEAELTALLTGYVDRPLTFAQLLETRSLITQKYVDAGYVTSGAFIPPQTLTDGVVLIRVVEGQLQTVNVQVTGKLNPHYVRDRLMAAGQGVLNVPQLLETLQLLQLSPLVEQISAELTASPDVGQSILNVSVVTARSFYPKALLDNGRNPLVGSFRRGAELEERNLTGNGDPLVVLYRNTDGSNEIDARYRLPLTPSNTTLSLGYRNLTGKVIEPPFNELDLRSYYEKYEVSLRQPLWQTPYQELALSLGFDQQNSLTTLLGENFPTRGADLDGQMRLASLRFVQEGFTRNDTLVLAGRSEFALGINAFGTTTPYDAAYNPQAPNPNYLLWRGQGQWVQFLAPDMLLVGQLQGQWANSPLPSLEQFTLGGLGSVVGYRQNTLLTDNGLFAALELRLPLYRQPEEKAVLQLVPFVNFGTGWNTDSPNPEVNTLASVGLGLLWQYSDRLSARIDWGKRLGKVPYLEGSSWQDDGIIFSITLSP